MATCCLLTPCCESAGAKFMLFRDEFLRSAGSGNSSYWPGLGFWCCLVHLIGPFCPWLSCSSSLSCSSPSFRLSFVGLWSFSKHRLRKPRRRGRCFASATFCCYCCLTSSFLAARCFSFRIALLPASGSLDWSSTSCYRFWLRTLFPSILLSAMRIDGRLSLLASSIWK